MTAEGLRAARAAIGLEPDAMAAQLGVTPHVYAAFEAGALAIPRRYAGIAAHYAGIAAQEAALAASGLASCDWMEAWNAAIPPWGSARLRPHLASGRQHFAGCTTCRTRAAYVSENCAPVPEYPVPWSHRMVRRVATLVARLRPRRSWLPNMRSRAP